VGRDIELLNLGLVTTTAFRFTVIFHIPRLIATMLSEDSGMCDDRFSRVNGDIVSVSGAHCNVCPWLGGCGIMAIPVRLLYKPLAK